VKFEPYFGIEPVDGWELLYRLDYDDYEVFRYSYQARHPKLGSRVLMVSAFFSRFKPTQARFEWLIKDDNGFFMKKETRLSFSGHSHFFVSNWSSEDIDGEIENASS